jgi:site-specific DNA-methyltransferase (adenine-specific)
MMAPLDTVIHGDCLDALRSLPTASVDAVVTDPPAGIAFMGKSWDTDKGGRDAWIAWLAEVMGECLRVLKPGGHAVVWALPRTSHWTATALEDAGFEIRDVITHHFGSGFPKSLDVSKAIDRAAGADAGPIPATEAARAWDGWGTALKPASEHWILCRKPLGAHTVAANVLCYGTGALNVDACRVGTEPAFTERKGQVSRGGILNVIDGERVTSGGAGRWPANLLLSHSLYCDEASGCAPGCPVAELDAQSGVRQAGARPAKRNTSHFGHGHGTDNGERIEYDTGGASRFFPTFRYAAKASRAERNRGCEGLNERPMYWSAGEQNHGSFQSPNTHRAAANHHPTVKPQSLMSWLITLITPPGGVVLDPFAGSGSTLVAAQAEGMRYIGIEREAEYVAIARARLASATPHRKTQVMARALQTPITPRRRVAAVALLPSLWDEEEGG